MTAGGPALGGRRAYVVWLPAVAVYFLAVFHRSSLGVAGIAATERFGISASELSSFTVLQLLVYAAMQVPVGVLLDRFGPRALLLTGAFVMTFAQLGFALTGSYAGAVAARVLVGMGDAMVFISVLRLVAAWFPAMRNPVFVAWTALIGQSGALVAALPLARSLEQLGWTTTFAASAGLGVLLGVLVLVLVRDLPPGSRDDRAARPVRAVVGDLRSAWRDPGTRLGFWSHFTAQFGTHVMGLLWGYPFFLKGENTGVAAAGALLSVLVLTQMLGGPLVGWVISHNPWQRSTVVLAIVGAMAGTWAVVLLWPGDAPIPLLVVLAITVGLGGPGSMVGFDVARTFNPASRLGSATGIVNVGGFLASLLIVLAIGVLLDVLTPGSSTDYPPSAFAGAMAVQYVGWGVGAAMIWRYRRRARAHLEVTQPDTFRFMTGRPPTDPG